MTFPPPSECRIVKVSWEDIVSVSNWNDDEDIGTRTCLTIGWLLEESETRIVLATSYDYEEERWADFTVLPKIGPSVEGV